MAMDTRSARAVVTGFGWLAAEPFEKLIAGKRVALPDAAPEITGFQTSEGAPAFGFELIDFKIETYLPNLKTYVDRTSALALAAAQLALQDAGLLQREARPADIEIGCSYATTFGCLEAMGLFWKKVKSTNPRFAPPLPFTHGYANSPSSLVCIEYGLRGGAAVFSGQETSGFEALLFAQDQIASGAAQIMLVCASESLTRPVHAHLNAGKRLSASGRLGLWQPSNDGIVPGEGAVCWIVESEASAKARNRAPYAVLAEVALASGDGALAKALTGLSSLDGSILVCTSSPDSASIDSEESSVLRSRSFSSQATVVSPKLFTGELFSVSPLLAGLLATRTTQAVPGAVPLTNAPIPQRIATALLLGRDPSGMAGVIHLGFPCR
jgi:3-oxoacyl-[acyl-carrier-protein] synthase III